MTPGLLSPQREFVSSLAGLGSVFLLLPGTYVPGYCRSPLRGWDRITPRRVFARNSGFTQGDIKNKIKGDGQECPSHTSGLRRRAEARFEFARFSRR